MVQEIRSSLREIFAEHEILMGDFYKLSRDLAKIGGSQKFSQFSPEHSSEEER